jgi:hypothetical protein
MLTPKQQKFKDSWEKQMVYKNKMCYMMSLAGAFAAIVTALYTAIYLKHPVDKDFIIIYSGVLVFNMITFYFIIGKLYFKFNEMQYQKILKLEKE